MSLMEIRPARAVNLVAMAFVIFIGFVEWKKGPFDKIFRNMGVKFAYVVWITILLWWRNETKICDDVWKQFGL